MEYPESLRETGPAYVASLPLPHPLPPSGGPSARTPAGPPPPAMLRGTSLGEGRPWPSALVDWYSAHKRDLPWRRTRDPWAILISEVMLQQTRVETVLPYYDRFIQRFPTFTAMARVSQDEVLALWSGLGYYRRARSLHACAVILQETGGFPPAGELARLPGVGAYTQAALASIAWGQPALALDGNALRVLARLQAIAQNVQSSALQASLRRQTEPHIPSNRAGDFTQGLMELGATLCLPRHPRCPTCPLHHFCRAHRHDQTDSYPVINRSKKKESLLLQALLVTSGDRVWLSREHNLPFLKQMWLPPIWTQGDCGHPHPGVPLGSVRHQVTFRAITVEVFAGTPGILGPGEWVAPDELLGKAVPSLTRKILQLHPGAPPW